MNYSKNNMKKSITHRDGKNGKRYKKNLNDYRRTGHEKSIQGRKFN